MNQIRERLTVCLWKLRQFWIAGWPDYRVGAGESIDHDRKVKKIRIAPGRNGVPLASFWSFWSQGSECYVAGRSHVGMMKLSFHGSGKWYSTFNKDRQELSPGHALPGGTWTHAVELRYLIGENILRPLPERPFMASGPELVMDLPPEHYLVAHLLFGNVGTPVGAPLPEDLNSPRLLDVTLRNGRTAVVVAAHFNVPAHVRRDLQLARALRCHNETEPDLRQLSMEISQVEITSEGIYRVSVIPLGPEAMATERLSWRRAGRVDWVDPK